MAVLPQVGGATRTTKRAPHQSSSLHPATLQSAGSTGTHLSMEMGDGGFLVAPEDQKAQHTGVSLLHWES